MYEEPSNPWSILSLGVYGARSAILPTVEYAPSQKSIGNRRMHLSSAPLRDVDSAQLFTGEDQGRTYCRGILFHYKWGGKQALGQCRINVDPCWAYRNPVALYYRHTERGTLWPDGPTPVYAHVRMQTSSRAEDEQLDDDWTYVSFDAGYILDFWFAPNYERVKQRLETDGD